MNHFSSGGYPGFDALPGKQLVCQSTVSGQTFGTAANPFGAAVTNPQDDLRLASVAMNVIDFHTFMVFDVFYTNQRIYAFYEHLPFQRASLGGSGEFGDYAAFSYAIPIATRTPGDFHTVAVAYNLPDLAQPLRLVSQLLRRAATQKRQRCPWSAASKP